jgi:outer membrane immunogenic protein
MQTAFDGVTTTHTQAGWTAGAGIEWAFADNWTAKVEYLFVDVGSVNVTCVVTACTNTTLGFTASGIPVSASLTENIVRAGVNFKFNGW